MTLSSAELFHMIVERTQRVPLVVVSPLAASTEGEAYARQLDVALMDAGFKADRSILQTISRMSRTESDVVGSALVHSVKKIVGDNVRHNTYFRRFPDNVPDTLSFWADLMEKSGISLPFGLNKVNLLALKGYGAYQHTYEEMVEAHGERLTTSGNTLRVLTAGGSLEEEGKALYALLAGTRVPLSETDMVYLKALAGRYTDPVETVIREVRATINAVRVDMGLSLDVGSPTDVLRVAVALSGGDVSLATNTRFKSFPKRVRRILMAGLDGVSGSHDSLAMALQHTEQWKRLGEKIHPNEFKGHENAKAVFKTVHGQTPVRSYAARVETIFKEGSHKEILQVLSENPGGLFRNLDRALTAGVKGLLPVLQATIGKVSGRVLISVHEHLTNRLLETKARMFRNRAGKAWVQDETRDVLTVREVGPILTLLEGEIARRLPVIPNLVVDPAVRGVALPLSEKNKGTGFGTLPRGSRIPVTHDIVRFFCYWKEKGQRTDYDLSVLLLDENFQVASYCSWTQLRDGAMVHSGDITSAPEGASEFIDVDLRMVDQRVAYIVPQVNVFTGDSYEEAAESFFGFMERVGGKGISGTKGLPYEPSTVRAKSEMRGKGKIALPMMFVRDADSPSGWSGVWAHIYLNGSANFNMAEKNGRQTGMMARGSVSRKPFTVGRLADMLLAKSTRVEGVDATYIGLQAPSDLKTAKNYTAVNFIELIPE